MSAELVPASEFGKMMHEMVAEMVAEMVVVRPVEIPPAPGEEQMKTTTYHCTFPRCKCDELTVGRLFVPPLEWINREVGRRRPVTDWSSQATEQEMAGYARCQHHAKESAVGLDYNRRHGISSMNRFDEMLRLADLKLDQAQFEKDQIREAYRFKHEQEKEERKARRLYGKIAQHCRRLAQGQAPVSAKSKNYGPVESRSAAGRKKKPSGEKKNKQQQGGKGKGKGR